MASMMREHFWKMAKANPNAFAANKGAPVQRRAKTAHTGYGAGKNKKKQQFFINVGKGKDNGRYSSLHTVWKLRWS